MQRESLGFAVDVAMSTGILGQALFLSGEYRSWKGSVFLAEKLEGTTEVLIHVAASFDHRTCSNSNVSIALDAMCLPFRGYD